MTTIGVPAWLPRLVIVGSYTVLLAIGANMAWLYLNGRQSDWAIFHQAAVSIGQGVHLYALEGPTGYIYPPFFAYILQPLAMVERGVAGALWVAVNTLAVGFTFHLLGSRLAGFVPQFTRTQAYALIVAGTFAVVGEQVSAVLRTGQTDAVILLAIVVAFCWSRVGGVWSGVLISLAVAIKYHAILFIALFAVRRQGLAVLGMIAGVAVFFSLPILSTGWSLYGEYLSSAAGGLARMIGLSPQTDVVANIQTLQWPRSVSLTSTVARWASSTTALLVGVTALVLLVCIGLAAMYKQAGLKVFWRTREIDVQAMLYLIVLAEVSVVVTAILIFGPQTTNRHMILAAIPAAVCLTMAIILWRDLLGKACAVSLVLFVVANAFPPSEWVAMRTAWRSVGGASWALLLVQMLAVAATVRVYRQWWRERPEQPNETTIGVAAKPKA